MKIAINQCPFCGAKERDLSHYRCGKPVKLCTKCGKDIMYRTQYIEYNKKKLEEWTKCGLL